MSEINDQSSDTSSELNWPVDHPMDRMIALDRVVFENVADQYVKGEDVTAFFTVLPDVKINPNEDQIGLLRVRNFFQLYHISIPCFLRRSARQTSKNV